MKSIPSVTELKTQVQHISGSFLESLTVEQVPRVLWHPYMHIIPFQRVYVAFHWLLCTVNTRHLVEEDRKQIVR